MKRFLSILLSALIIAAIIPASAIASFAAESVKPGDVNFDGEVNVQDAIIIYRAYAGLIELTAKQKAAGNIVGGDKTVDAADAIAVMRIDAGLMYNDGWVELVTPTEAVDTFNKAINNVKPKASKITLTKETNTQVGEVVTDLPKSLVGMMTSLIASNMGNRDLSEVEPAVTVEQKNQLFPVENQSWSSILTADDVDNYYVSVNGSFRTITLYIKDDEISSETAAGYGHNGKVFSVISPSVITENSGDNANMISNVKTGTKNGRVTIVIDTTTGNVISADYYFEWTMSLTALTNHISMCFGLCQSYSIDW